ncbi:integral membrane sensor signal transduction histidine kinase [Frigoribacterium sp. CFBP 13729]|uniref:sensor histidine kinase n=1 Tax=Frigoribacterium sp. CFBP 13729 TaxID=2775293 RepID=UPI001786E28E|nr:ATP-binding protein [Frigoribacterium sp. CFBP 13729]MBD8608982.1 integral membrane sensor signal transduction histidine kinase [Frigoribacterium sp. CFBP 13729]
MSTPRGEGGSGAVPHWTTVARPVDRTLASGADPRPSGVVAWVAVVSVLVIVAVAVAALFAARGLAEAESVRDAADRADRIADAIVEPALTDALVDGDEEARRAMDDEVRDHVLSSSIVRVKIWDDTGRVVWSDEPALIDRRFTLDEDDLEALAAAGNGNSTGTGVEAEVSDLTAPENEYERDRGKLLEAYRAVATPGGQTLLFEVYFRYDEVLQRSGQLFAGFAGITIGSIVLVVLLLLPVLRQLLRALDRARVQREALLERALDASAAERRRIAGALHDGVVQDLVGASLAVSAESGSARARGDVTTADGLDRVAGALRGSVGGLRSLLVDIYPPNLARAGIGPALDDLAAGVRSRGVAVVLEADAASALDDEGQRLVFRVVQECLANVVAHARASVVSVTADRAAEGGVVVTVADDGAGFDPELLTRPEPDHFGLRVLADVAGAGGAGLDLQTAPGHGTRWRLTLPASAVAPAVAASTGGRGDPS